MTENTSNGPTFFQLNYFVVGREPSNQAKLHRCLQEIKERSNTINNVELEIAELEDVNALYIIEAKKSFENDEIKVIRLRQINRKIKANEKQIESLKAKIFGWNEEINFLKHIYNQIVKEVPLKPWNDYEVQLEYWNEKMAQEIRSRLIMNAPVDIEVIKTVLSLPDRAPIKQQLLECLQKDNKKISQE